MTLPWTVDELVSLALVFDVAIAELLTPFGPDRSRHGGVDLGASVVPREVFDLWARDQVTFWLDYEGSERPQVKVRLADRNVPSASADALSEMRDRYKEARARQARLEGSFVGIGLDPKHARARRGRRRRA